MSIPPHRVQVTTILAQPMTASHGSEFMANAESRLLPGSNLTNLLVLRGDPQNGVAFGQRRTAAPPTRARRRRNARRGGTRCRRPERSAGGVRGRARRHRRSPTRPRLTARTLALLFALELALRAIARLWRWPAQLLNSTV
jgi:hypothetical protein